MYLVKKNEYRSAMSVGKATGKLTKRQSEGILLDGDEHDDSVLVHSMIVKVGEWADMFQGEE